VNERLRALGRRWHWFGRVLDVQDRVGEVNGGFLASAITISVFTALFPLLLVAIAVVGMLAAGDSTVPTRLIDTLGLSGTAASTMRDAIETASESRQAASIIGLLGLAWSGSGVAVALQQGIRAPWQERSEGIRDRLLGLAWLVAAGIGFAGAMALGTALNFLPDSVPKALVAAGAVLFGVVVEIGLFWWMFWGLGTRRVPAKDLLPGAIVAGIGFEALKLVGTVYVPQLVARSSSLYGPLGVVFAILAWLALFARLVVYASTTNAVRYESRVGTTEVLVHVPLIPGREPVAATRGGVMLDPGTEPAVPEPKAGSAAEERAGDHSTPSVDVVDGDPVPAEEPSPGPTPEPGVASPTAEPITGHRG
jgi:membrane protein